MQVNRLRELLVELATWNPCLTGATVYYIGNCEGFNPDTGSYRLDDRSWAIHMPVVRIEGNQHHSAAHNVVIGPTSALSELSESVAAFKIGFGLSRALAELRERHGVMDAAALINTRLIELGVREED